MSASPLQTARTVAAIAARFMVLAPGQALLQGGREAVLLSRVVLRQRYVDLALTALVGQAAIPALMVSVPLRLGPQSTDFYTAVAGVGAASLIAVAVDARSIAPPTLTTAHERAGLLLAIATGLLASIVASLVAIGIGHGSPWLFALTVGPGGTALLMLLLAVVLRAAEYGERR